MQDGSFTSAEKLTIARMLIEDVKVNCVEIGSARVSQGEEVAASKVLQWATESGHAASHSALYSSEQGHRKHYPYRFEGTTHHIIKGRLYG